MKTFLLSIKLFLLSPLLLSQSLYSESVITSVISGYQINSLSGYGFENNNLASISNISNGNPALLTGMHSLSFGISKQFNSEIQGPYNIRYSQVMNWFPQSAGFAICIGEFYLGAGMSQTYNSGTDLGKIEITTIEQPDGTGEYFDITTKTTIVTSSLLAAYPFHNLFSAGDLLSAGAQLDLNFIHDRESIWNIKVESDSRELTGKIGFIYKFSENLPLTQLSLYFEKGFKNRNPWIAKNLMTDVEPDTSSGRIPARISTAFSLISYMPDKFSLGILYQATEKFIVTGNISNIFWHNYQRDIHNQIELSSNLIYKWDSFITTSAGIYITDRTYLRNYSSNSAVFFSLGAILNQPGFNIEAALADSHIFSDEIRKQTLIKIGFNIFI